ncbi:hypothetical protein LFM56_11900 [Cellulomonas iranensis]|uniref:hypothetical protein n=1 Tax=Cellulomonas iranensis TaxID=76862 RepID=UPI001CF1FE92|nr:hypothetical protein [Cellulomonas iranensis]UCN13608.1 hypothetical protein LFM56_11900 [Cellulomonas iranensis]
MTVLVHGDLGGRRLTDPARGYSQKLIFVERVMRKQGQHIHVIDDRGFEALLHGGAARCHRLRASSGALIAEVGEAQRPPDMGGC